MRHRLPLLILLAAMLGLALSGPAAAARPAKKARVFTVCHHGCPYPAIQKGVDAAARYAHRHGGVAVTVAIRPGTYAEGVVLDGGESGRRYGGMTIEGTSRDRKKTILEGRGAADTRAGIAASGVDGLVVRNLWARNYTTAGFLIEGDGGAPCKSYMLENLLASGNGVYGLAAHRCVGGKMLDSAAYRQGGAGFSVAETPCDAAGWSPYSGSPCQARPRWTLLEGDAAYENALGFSGTNSKYVRVIEDVFYDNGAGVVAASLPSLGGGPNGWNMIERNFVFWNNYDYFLAGSAIGPALGAIGELNDRALNYPIGVGVAIFGGDGDIVRANHIFGNYKWGVATFSLPGESPVVDPADEAKNVDNEVVENAFGRGGADPNGEYDVFDDATGGGNCWGANSAGATFAVGNGKLAPGAIYPVCPVSKVGYGSVRSVNSEAGLQLPSSENRAWKTVLGYLATDPPQNQQCSWVRRVASHPRFQTFAAAEVPAHTGELGC
ncbi:MAG TPA: hypothetical protein VMH33_07765 [Solirubrobacterales bacterium]|nr:hypothetical protein [Solirubrobacterales bacterium]